VKKKFQDGKSISLPFTKLLADVENVVISIKMGGNRLRQLARLVHDFLIPWTYLCGLGLISLTLQRPRVGHAWTPTWAHAWYQYFSTNQTQLPKKQKEKKKATRPICFSGLRFSLHLVLVYEQIGCLASAIKDKCSRGSKVFYNHVNLPWFITHPLYSNRNINYNTSIRQR